MELTTAFAFAPRDHVEIGETLDLVDIKRAVEIAGTRTYYLKNEAVLLEWAVLRFALDHMMRKDSPHAWCLTS